MALTTLVRPKRRWWAVAARPLTAMGGLPLDGITTPGVVTVAAYGLRKMRSGYNGPAVNIRRSSDNVTIDIGFRGVGDLDVQTLGTFLGVNQGFVTTWYDQSGNGRNLTQSTPASQPQIVSSVPLAGGRPAIASTASTALSGIIPAATIPLTLSAVACRTGALTSFASFISLIGGATPPLLFYLNAPGIAVGNAGADNVSIAGVADNQFHSVVGVDNGAGSSLQVDGATASGTLTSQPGSTQLFVTNAGLVGYVAEAIYFSGALNAGDVANLSASQRTYWVPAPLLLDIAQSAAAAYSLRKLTNAYTGPAINVRRSSDNATQDIGFSGNDLNVGAFSAFVGGGQGFVATWYDQSGNGNNAVQATTARQPQIILSVLNGMPALLFGDVSAFGLSVASVASIDNPFANGGTFSAVINQTSLPGTGDRMFDKTNTRFQRAPWTWKQAATTTTGSWAAPSEPPLGGANWAVQYSSASLSNVPTINVNGIAQTLGGVTQPVGTVSSDAGSALIIGNSSGFTVGFPGHIAEMIFWKSLVALPGLYANQKAYWGTP